MNQSCPLDLTEHSTTQHGPCGALTPSADNIPMLSVVHQQHKDAADRGVVDALTELKAAWLVDRLLEPVGKPNALVALLLEPDRGLSRRSKACVRRWSSWRP